MAQKKPSKLYLVVQEDLDRHINIISAYFDAADAGAEVNHLTNEAAKSDCPDQRGMLYRVVNTTLYHPVTNSF